MRVIHNRWLPPKRYDAINLFGCLFCRRDTTVTADLIQHERIHTAQMKELLFIGFYLWYLLEWLIRLPMKSRAYTHISFEREAYTHMHDPDYLQNRKRFAWLQYYGIYCSGYC